MGIRKAIQQDAAAIAAIGQCVWIDTYATQGVRDSIASYVLSEFSVEKAQTWITSMSVFVLEVDFHLIAYVVVSKDPNPEIDTLYVLPRYQGGGYGTQLLQHVISLYQSVVLSCWDKNTRAIAFYRRFGFTGSGECQFEFGGEKHRNIVLRYNTTS